MFKQITKTITLLAFLILFGLSAMAQDVIYLINGDKINSIVQEIGTDYVKYKKFDNQTGPIYNVPIAQIFRIKYENGSIDIFNEIAKPVEPKIEQSESPNNNPYNNLKSEFYRICKDDTKMLEFFRKNNFPEYYHHFASACRKRDAGIGVLVPGAMLTGLGIVLLAVGIDKNNEYDRGTPYYWPYYTPTEYSENYEKFLIAGGAIFGVGSILTIVGIPVSVNAGRKKKDIKEGFAQTYFGVYSDVYQPTLNIGITQRGGFGLTLKF